jgi:hypothetical protein
VLFQSSLWSPYGHFHTLQASVVLVVFINPPPPKRLAVAVGSAGSIYAAYGEQYKAFFAGFLHPKYSVSLGQTGAAAFA